MGLVADRFPVGFEPEFTAWMAEAIQEMRGCKIRLHIAPSGRFKIVDAQSAGIFQRPVNQFTLTHLETGMLGAYSAGQFTDDLMIAAALTRRIDQLRSQLDELMSTALINVVMFQEHGGWQHNIRQFIRFGHELFMHADEQIIAGKTLLYCILVRRDRNRVGVLGEQDSDRRPALQIMGVIVQDRAYAALVQHANRWIKGI